MSRTVTFILLLLICLGANAAPAGDNTVKTSFATFTLADGWRLASPQKPESKAKVTHNGITIKQKTCDIFGPKYALLLIGRYDTGKTADIDGVKDYIRKWLETDNRDNICNLKWEFDENRNMWIGTDFKITSSNSEPDNPDIKITRKDVIYLLQNGKYIDVFWATSHHVGSQQLQNRHADRHHIPELDPQGRSEIAALTSPRHPS